jgi:adenine phosphoribosyltransferase
MISLAHEDLRKHIRDVPGFPKPGVVFKDITTLLKEAKPLQLVVDLLHDHYAEKNIEKIVCIESRGFILGGALACRLGAGFIPVRKPGKLPSAILREEYQLEYGVDAIEMHTDAIGLGERVLVHDDLLATGGTASAACKLVEKAGGTIVGLSFLIELTFLHGRDRLAGRDIFSIMKYDSE